MKNDDSNLPTTLAELPGINQDQLNRVSVERNDDVVAVSDKNPTSTATESLELSCNDEGLIVVQTDAKPIEEAATTVQVARTK